MKVMRRGDIGRKNNKEKAEKKMICESFVTEECVKAGKRRRENRGELSEDL